MQNPNFNVYNLLWLAQYKQFNFRKMKYCLLGEKFISLTVHIYQGELLAELIVKILTLLWSNLLTDIWDIWYLEYLIMPGFQKKFLNIY